MKEYNITVNGQTYQVQVEEVKGQGQAQQTTQPAPRVTPKPQAQPANKPAPQAQPKPSVAPGSGNIIAPMPGTVLELKVEEGQEVKAGDVVLILEAMKMENEITADSDGKITKIYATKGSSVNTGDPLVAVE